MRPKFLSYLFAILSYLALTPLAAQTFMCPTSFDLIKAGDSIAKVAASCGEPTTTSSKDIPRLAKEPTEQWFYQGTQRESVQVEGEVNIPSNLDIDPTRQPELIITFDKNSKVSGVSLGGQDVGSTTLCGSGSRIINVGDSQAKVRNLCGSAQISNRGTRTRFAGTIKQTIWNYKFGAYQPSVVLTFEDGLLTNIER